METENILYSEVCKHRQFVLSFSSFSTHSFFFLTLFCFLIIFFCLLALWYIGLYSTVTPPLSLCVLSFLSPGSCGAVWASTVWGNCSSLSSWWHCCFPLSPLSLLQRITSSHIRKDQRAENSFAFLSLLNWIPSLWFSSQRSCTLYLHFLCPSACSLPSCYLSILLVIKLAFWLPVSPLCLSLNHLLTLSFWVSCQLRFRLLQGRNCCSIKRKNDWERWWSSCGPPESKYNTF